MEQKTTKKLFLEAYDAHADEIYRFCFYKISNVERAEDLTQEVFVQFWQSLRRDDTIQNPKAFLYTIARNKIIDWYRKKKESSLDAITDKGFDPRDTTSAPVSQSAEFNEVLGVIHTLDEQSRDILLLRYVENWSPQEIASLTNESANVISVRLNRAVKKVQQIMQTKKDI